MVKRGVAKNPRKRLSKRPTLRLKNKRHRKRVEKERKIRKLSRRNPFQGKSVIKKDPGIPNLWPFKQQLLEKMHQDMDDEEEQKQIQKQKKSQQAEMASLRLEAQQKIERYDARARLLKDKEQSDEWGHLIKQNSLSKASKRTYYREFNKVVQAADVLIEVLDARDPEGCRAREVEKHILSQYPDKKIVLVLNKIDLVPQEVIRQWLPFLRNDFPTVAFKSSTQNNQRSNLATSSADSLSSDRLSGASLGGDQLVQLLKNYCRSEDIKKTITVGIIGYPNVGKSSLINSLRRSKVVGVGSRPGFTTQMQEVKLDKDIHLLDCPGIIFSQSEELTNEVILRNSIPIEKLHDPITPVELILERCKIDRLTKRYGLPPCDSTEDFLSKLATSRGKLASGGRPKIKAAAMLLLKDWNQGKIPFYTLPPQVDELTGAKSNVIWGTAYDDDSVLQHIPQIKDRFEEDFIPMIASMTISDKMAVDDEEDEDLVDDEDVELSDEEEDGMAIE